MVKVSGRFWVHRKKRQNKCRRGIQEEIETGLEMLPSDGNKIKQVKPTKTKRTGEKYQKTRNVSKFLEVGKQVGEW